MTNIKIILFWVSLILSIISIIWNILNNNHSKFFILISVLYSIILLQLEVIDKRLLKLEIRTNNLIKL